MKEQKNGQDHTAAHSEAEIQPNAVWPPPPATTHILISNTIISALSQNLGKTFLH